MLYKVIVCILGFAIAQQSIAALPPCYFVHYSTEDGLPQHTIMDMLQDKDGLMWFVTWDGLCRFDGYHFTSYKINRSDPYLMKSNRIDHIHEDKYGYLWLQSYDGELHRFDPRTHSFRGLQSVEGTGNFAFLSSRIVLMPSGKTWLLSRTTGCICIADSSFATRVYNYENGLLKGKGVINVFEDKQLNSWLLTDNGLVFIPYRSDTPDFYFAEKYIEKNHSRQSFYCAKELNGKIWFGSSKGRIWQYDQQKGSFDLFETHSNSGITDIKELPGNKVLIVSSRNGFFILDQHSGKLAHFDTKTLPEMKSNQILSCYPDNYNNLWIESELLGISKFDLNTHTLKRFEMPIEGVNPDIFPPKLFLFEDASKRLWVHPKGGGFALYNPKEDSLEPFCNDPQSPDKRFSNVLHSAYPDRQGNIWLCTRSHGLEKVVFETQAFNFTRLDPNQRSETANDVRALFEDKDGNIWISAKDGKLRVFDEHDKLLGIVTGSGQIGSGTPLKGVVYALAQDNLGNIWLGTRGEGVYILEPTTGNGKGLSFRVSQYKNDPDNVYSISENSVYSIFQDSHGNVWTGTYGGGLNLAERLPGGEYRFINHRNNLKTYPLENGHRIRYITEDKRGNICIGTTLGLIMFKTGVSSPDNIRYRYYARIPGDEKSLGNNDIHFIKPTSKGEMYIATFGGGINLATAYDAEGYPVRFRSYTKQEGLPADVTLSILEDREGTLWITTENNLTRFNPSTESFETFGEIKRQMHTNNFSEAAALYTKKGKIYLGHSHGLLSFLPQEIKKNTFKPYIALDKFLLFNKEVPVGNKSALAMNIDKLEKITLKHNQNFFSIGYAALDHVNPQNISYAYRLDGIDNDWVYVQQQRMANYTNIPKGEYTFRVKSSNSDGIWTDNERSLKITVEPSFWETPWAYALYGLLFMMILFICVRILFIIYRLKDKVEMEQQLAEMKLNFFTDISHEIRTPLTMVSAPLEFLLHNERTPKDMRYHLELIENNARRMLRLVNQILDFNKIQHHKMHVEPVEITHFAQDICDNFRKTAEGQDIHFRFVNEAGNQTLNTDKDYMEKILFNLLSNAFKYTPGGKSVSVRLFMDNKHFCIEVADAGKGISREKQKMLFKRFASFNEDKSKPSTGIGLSIVKELADKLNAQITVESEPGKGSVFTVYFPVSLPVSMQAQDEKEEQEVSGKDSDGEALCPAEDNLENDCPKTPSSQPTVLVVEDDDDLRLFLHTMLKDDYTVVEAGDGISGLKIARQILPDFIVSDIMMPEMDGVELLQQLKSHISTSHIPVVLLTAKTTIESKLTGLEFGADDYITKPFSVPYFKARIANLLKQRRRLHELYANHFNMPGLHFEPDKPAITLQDESFMKKVMAEIENNMSNGEFLIEELSNTLGVSRTVFFKKIKSITGLAPVEFVRDIRLKRAVQLLDSGQFSIKEVSFMVGISDPAYFRKCFKKRFGKTPAEYKKNEANAS